MSYIVYKDKSKRYLYVHSSDNLNLRDILKTFYSEDVKTSIVILRDCEITKELIEFLSIILVTDFNVTIESETDSQSKYLAGLGFFNVNRETGTIRKHETRYDKEEVKKKLVDVLGYDLSSYNDEYVDRTLKRFNHKFNNKDVNLVNLLDEPGMVKRFLEVLSTGVTSFFRDEQYYKFINEKVIPHLETFPSIRVWSAGSSTGEEAYSLALLLEHHGLLDRTLIYGTDYNISSLKKGKLGYYALPQLMKAQATFASICGGSLHDHISVNGKVGRFTDTIRKRVQFFHHDLMNEASFNTFHLILCRNVLIYVKHDEKHSIMNNIFSSSEEGTYVVFGREEKQNSKKLEKVSKSMNIYRTWKER